ncbi:MAG: DUF2163 domain-containing protein, partial [Burkholderiales bacterium]
GLAQALSQRIGELYSPECRADLGDHRCRVPIDPPVIARDTPYGEGDVVKVATAMTGIETRSLPLINPGFDAGNLTGWEVVSGSAQAKIQNGDLTPHTGSHFLEGGSVASFEVRQTVDLTAVLDPAIIDSGQITLDCACSRANGATDSVDEGRVILELLDAMDAVLATAWDTGFESFAGDGTWHLRAISGVPVPAGSRKLRIRFLGQPLGGTVCNAALDTISATLTDAQVPLLGSAVYENRIYLCMTAGTTATEQPVYDTTPNAETTDGTAVFAAQESWTRHGAVTAVIDRRRFTIAIDEPRAVDGWFSGGVIAWETGANAGRAMEVKDWSEDGSITLFLPMPDTIAVSDRFSISPGCDKRLATCAERFANVLKFRGEPYVPGQNALMSYPDAH